MKILLVSSSSGSRGGGELYLLYLGAALARRGHTVGLWASSHPRMDELATAFARFGEVIRADYRNTYDHPARSLATLFQSRAKREAVEQWQNWNPDILHLNKQNLEDGLDLLEAVNSTRIPTLCTIHLTQSAAYLRAKVAWLRDLVAKKALLAYRGSFVTVLENRQRDLEDFLGTTTNIRTILNGVPVISPEERIALRKSQRAAMQLEDGQMLIVAVGRMVSQKRPLLFLDMARRIHARLPHTRFVWIGDGPLSIDWDYRVSENRLSGIVHRETWQTNVQPFLAAADLFLHVAEYEGLPLALLEAMSIGLPCAVKDNLLREMPFLNPANSIAVGDEDTWIDLLHDDKTLLARGIAARQLVEERFSCDQMAAQYEKEYRKVIQG